MQTDFLHKTSTREHYTVCMVWLPTKPLYKVSWISLFQHVEHKRCTDHSSKVWKAVCQERLKGSGASGNLFKMLLV